MDKGRKPPYSWPDSHKVGLDIAYLYSIGIDLQIIIKMAAIFAQ